MTTNPLTLTSPKQRDGGHYEQLAKDFLLTEGLTLIAQNWQQPKVGELDLVMLQSGQAWDILVFIEVRKRKVSHYGDALMSVTPSKQRKLIKTARYFMQQHPKYANLECRFDVIAFNETASSLEKNKPLIQQDNLKRDYLKRDHLKRNHVKTDSLKNNSLDKASLEYTRLVKDSLYDGISYHSKNDEHGEIITQLMPKPEWIQGAFIASAW